MLKFTLAIAALLQMVACNVNWNTANFISDLQKRHAKLNFTNRPNQDKQLYVHLVAHTHDDVGWLKTVDDYYSGTNMGVQRAVVNLVLSNVVEELVANPHRKFTYVEMKFFSMWYDEQTETIKEQVKQLIKEGRFEFVNAGWSMHDEACPHFEDMINNMMQGHQWLLKEFGVKPRIGWHIDPFGHSNANPRLFADMGFEGWFFARLDHADRDQRIKDKAMNFLWRPFAKHFGNQKQIFTGVMQDHYCWPQGFWYDDLWMQDDPFVTDKKLDTFNADDKVQVLQKYINEMSGNYQGNSMLIPFGCDFTFANARMNFEQMDALIDYFNAHNTANITLMYSTPGGYIDSLYAQNLTWPVKYDDMFPYSSSNSDYWSGYYTSRQAGKKQVRDGQANLHASGAMFSQRVVQEDVTQKEVDKILDVKDQMMDWMGVYQHHDAISGTAKQYVADNYVIHLSRAMSANNDMYAWQLMSNMKKDLNVSVPLKHTFFNGMQNDTVKETPMGTVFENDTEVLVVVHNPSSVTSKQFVEIQTVKSNYNVSVWCSKSKKFYDITTQVGKMYQKHRLNGGNATADWKLQIPYQLGAMQVGYIKLLKVPEGQTIEANTVPKSYSSNMSLEYFDDGKPQILFKFKKNHTCPKTGKVMTQEQDFAVNLGYYRADNGSDGQGSAAGAYELKPMKGEEFQYQYAARTNTSDYMYQHEPATDTHQWTFEFHNKNYSESAILRVSFSPYFTDLIQFDVELNGISIDDQDGKEIVVNWKFYDFEDGDTFWTDSNGLEMQKRVKDYRYSFDLDKSGNQNVSWNYYPINSAIAMRNQDKNGTNNMTCRNTQVTIMNERSQAGSATIQKGVIEMIHNRRLLHDDNLGVAECLNETDKNGYGMKVNGRYYLQILNLDMGESSQREKQNQIDKPLTMFFASLNGTELKDNQEIFATEPTSDLKLQQAYTSDCADWDKFGRMVLMPLWKNKIYVRFENSADKFDSYAPNLQIDMEKFAQIFWMMANPGSENSVFVFPKIVEVDLTNNMSEMDVQQMRKNVAWKGKDDDEIAEMLASNPELKAVYERDPMQDKMDNITFVPQDIRSFVIYYDVKAEQAEEKPVIMQ